MLKNQVVEAGTFTKPNMTLKVRLLAQMLQNSAPVEAAYTAPYDGAAPCKVRPRLAKKVDAAKQEMIDRDAGGVS